MNTADNLPLMNEQQEPRCAAVRNSQSDPSAVASAKVEIRTSQADPLETCGEEQSEKMTIAQVARALTVSSSISHLAVNGADQPKKNQPELSPIQVQLTDALDRAFAKYETNGPDSPHSN
ncbi:MAG: hypothetical protein ACXWIU_10105 [Limisphaerales bacterium]